LYKYLSTGIERKYAKTLEEGRKFLASNKTRPEVKTTSDGIQYEVVKEGTGSIPNDNDSVIARFIGYTLDGKVFISSENYAQPFKILQAIPGCRKALHLMKEGSRYKIYLPTELAYARNPIPGNILKPNMAVMFDIILIHIVSKDPDFIENRNNIKK
jgi:FKBP-type peptidyl-prolyl cis-trans isomerase